MGTPYLPIAHSRLGPVEKAYISPNDNIVFGLGPCSQAITVSARHQEMCWGSFPSKWLNQSDTSAHCIWDSKLSDIQAFYTTPRTNEVTQISGLSPTQSSQVTSAGEQQPPSCGEFYGGLTYPNSSICGAAARASSI